jgi:hypothetical protein
MTMKGLTKCSVPRCSGSVNGYSNLCDNHRVPGNGISLCELSRARDIHCVKAHLFSPLNNLSHREGPPKSLQARARRSFDGLKNGLESSIAPIS